MYKHAARYTHSTLHNFCIWYDFMKQLTWTNKEIRLVQFAFRHSHTQSGVNHRQGSNLVVCYCSNYGKWLANFVYNIRKVTKRFLPLPLLKNCCTRHTFCVQCWLLKSAVYSLCVSDEQMAIRQPSYIYKLTPWCVDIVGHSCQPSNS